MKTSERRTQWLSLFYDGVLSSPDQEPFHVTGEFVAGDGDSGASAGTEICDEPHSFEGPGGEHCGCGHLLVASQGRFLLQQGALPWPPNSEAH